MPKAIPTITEQPPEGQLTFKATYLKDRDREMFIGVLPVYQLIKQHFITPIASKGLAPEILSLSQKQNGLGPVQRRTNTAHVQGIVDYIAKQAEDGEPWAFNAIVLYSTEPITFATQSVGVNGSAGEAQLESSLSIGEGLHRCLGWTSATGLYKVKGVKRPDLSPAAAKAIQHALIPAIVIVEPDLHRQKKDFHDLNLQKPLNPTELTLTDDTSLSDLARGVIDDIEFFEQRIERNAASVGAASVNVMSFAQLRFAVASYLLGRKTRNAKTNEQEVEKIVQERGLAAVRAELREAFTEIVTLAGLERIHLDRTHSKAIGEYIVKLRKDTLLLGSSTWRALMVALHDVKVEHGVDAQTAMDRVRASGISWRKDSEFFAGSLLEVDLDTKALTGKRLHSRESIDNAATKLTQVMIAA